MGNKQENQVDDNVLRAFAAGKLDATQESRIAAAVNQSPELIARLAEISNDGLMQRLKNSSEPLVKADVADAESPSSLLNQGVKVAKKTGVTDVPTELATYSEYKIIKELGRGGMGVVYLAKNIRMDRLEVLKVLSERLLDHGGAKERFLREIRAVSKLNHASIVTSYSMLPLDDLMVFAMEHVHGMDLHKFIRKHTRLPIGLACSFAQQFAAGLQHAHEKGLVHRDVKPSNAIVYKSDGQLQLKILDFGLAKATSEKNQSGLTQDGSLLGTPEYMSPEQALNAAKADIRADIYSLGCTLYFMLTGQPPFSGTHGEVLMAHAQRDARQVTLLRPEVPSELAAVVARMMAKDPQKRYQTPAEVHVALKPFLGSSKQIEKSPRAAIAAETNTVNDLGAPSRDTSVEQALPELSLTPDHSIASELSPQQQIATLMADHRASQIARGRRKRRRASLFGKNLYIALPLVGTLLAGLLWLGALTFRTADGTIIIENLPVDADVLVDGKRLEIVWNAGKDKAEAAIKPGTHQVEVKSKGMVVYGSSVEIEADEVERLKVVEQAKPTPSQAESSEPDVSNALAGDPRTELASGESPVKDAVDLRLRSLITERGIPDDLFGFDESEMRAFLLSEIAGVQATVTGTGKASIEMNGDELIVRGTKKGKDVNVTFGDPSWTDYDFLLEVNLEREGTVELIASSDTAHKWICVFRTSLDPYPSKASIYASVNGEDFWSNPSLRNSRAKVAIRLGEWRTLRVRCVNTCVESFVEERRILESEHERISNGRVGIRCYGDGAFRIRNLRVIARDGRLLWAGFPKIPSL